MSAVECAIDCGSAEVLKLLTDSGVDVHACNKVGMTFMRVL